MPLYNENLTALMDRVYSNYTSLLRPLDQTPRHNLLKVLARVEGGMYHQIQGDLSFLADQLFPDTATAEYLRMHWSDRVPPLHAIAATGWIKIAGTPGSPVPAGLVYISAAGKRYFTDTAYRVAETGFATAVVKAEESGAASNLAAGQELKLSSAIPIGLDSKAVTIEAGVGGGVDAETDESYLIRVLTYLRNPTRYGKSGEFAAWAMDASPEVSAAWEYKNFGHFGALLIQVISGNQTVGVSQVANLPLIQSYIKAVAPPVIFSVKTPAVISINPTIILKQSEDTLANRDLCVQRLKDYLQVTAKPGISYTSGILRDVIIDGLTITGGTVKINGDTAGEFTTTILQYPVLGVVSWS